MAEAPASGSPPPSSPPSPPPDTKPRPETVKGRDQGGGRTRINIGVAFHRWRRLMASKRMKCDAELATFLLDGYLRTKSQSGPEQTSLDGGSAETCESVRREFPFMSSSNEAEWETCADPSVQSPENGKEPGRVTAAGQRLKGQDERTTTKQSENKENRDTEEDEEEEFSTSLSVGDGRYLVDLGSSSEIIVDEECVLQLFKTCQKCKRQCTVRKRVRGLKLVVNQTCNFCQRRREWTNLPDDDDDRDRSDFRVNGKDRAHGRTSTAVSPCSS